MKGSFSKSPPELVEAFDRATPGGADVQRRQMFGYPSCFVNGNMFAGLFADRVFVRLAEEDRKRLVEAKRATPFEPMGRAMKEYVALAPAVVAHERDLRWWLARALEHARSLPPRESSARRGARLRQ